MAPDNAQNIQNQYGYSKFNSGILMVYYIEDMFDTADFAGGWFANR